MTLGELVRRASAGGGLPLAAPSGPAADVVVTSIEHDSRQVVPGAVFVAVRGQHADAARFAPEAVVQGAVAVVAETPPPRKWRGPWLIVGDARAALARLAAVFYEDPSRHLLVVGVTGTNGKTTTSYLITSVFEQSGTRCGRVGTVSYLVGREERKAPHTTPEASTLQRLMREMLDEGCSACVMEVSSHALAMRRADDVHFGAAVFTNLTRDHLDYHGTMESYFQAKRRLFELLPLRAPAVINIDDPAGRRLLTEAPRAVTYGMTAAADVTAADMHLTIDGMSFVARTPRGDVTIRSPLPGRPNVYNALAATSVGIALDIPLDAIARGIAAVTAVPGRFQIVSEPTDSSVVLVDYAHTDDALRNLLETVRPLAKGRVIVLFGCGGDRDRTKRPLMGAVASRLADFVVLTSDNPRSEDPAQIIEEIKSGLVAPAERGLRRNGQAAVPQKQTPWVALIDRRAAIERAIDEARPNDVVVISGKGHETYQVIGTRVLPFDDAAVAREILAEKRSGSRAGSQS